MRNKMEHDDIILKSNSILKYNLINKIGRPFVFGYYYSTIIKITYTLTLFP